MIRDNVISRMEARFAIDRIWCPRFGSTSGRRGPSGGIISRRWPFHAQPRQVKANHGLVSGCPAVLGVLGVLGVLVVEVVSIPRQFATALVSPLQQSLRSP